MPPRSKNPGLARLLGVGRLCSGGLWCATSLVPIRHFCAFFYSLIGRISVVIHHSKLRSMLPQPFLKCLLWRSRTRMSNSLPRPHCRRQFWGISRIIRIKVIWCICCCRKEITSADSFGFEPFLKVFAAYRRKRPIWDFANHITGISRPIFNFCNIFTAKIGALLQVIDSCHVARFGIIAKPCLQQSRIDRVDQSCKGSLNPSYAVTIRQSGF